MEPEPDQHKTESRSIDKDSQSNQNESVHLSDQVLQKRSASRDSSVNDDPKSFIDSISAVSGRQNWSSKDVADYDPSISSIKGDSVSATIADYDRKHRAKAFDNQSRASAQILNDSSLKNDDLSVNINYYAASSSTSGVLPKPVDNVDASNIDVSNINPHVSNVNEEIVNAESSGDDLVRRNRLRHNHQGRRKNLKNKSHRHGRRHSSSHLEQALEIDNLPPDLGYQNEPIVIRGNGNLTLFGLSNSFNTEFPSSLIGRVSKEEFHRTMSQVNTLLRGQQSLSAKLLLFGSLFCCCTLGFSLVWPSIALKKRSKMILEKFLASENSRLYSRLGLNWKISEQRCYSNHAFVECVIMIEFTPKINLYLPD